MAWALFIDTLLNSQIDFMFLEDIQLNELWLLFHNLYLIKRVVEELSCVANINGIEVIKELGVR